MTRSHVEPAIKVMPFQAQQQEQARRPPALAAQHTEQLWAAGVVGAAGRTRSGAERRARTTVVAGVAAAQARRVCSRAASTPAVGWLGPRSEPV
jgi:hypothetical protein